MVGSGGEAVESLKVGLVWDAVSRVDGHVGGGVEEADVGGGLGHGGAQVGG